MNKHWWLIWSIEHNGWWKPNSHGYTGSIDEAGRYTYEEALQIVKDANSYLRHTPNEAMLPEPKL